MKTVESINLELVIQFSPKSKSLNASVRIDGSDVKVDLTSTAVAAECAVSRAFVYKILAKLEEEGEVQDPHFHPRRVTHTVVCGDLTQEHEMYLLALRAESPARSNNDYVCHLYWQYGVKISASSISNFFLHRFDFAYYFF